jgi:large subunit ribosomal protein L13
MSTHSLKASEIEKKWWVVDAKDLVLGRLAVVIATYLRGKHKPTFTPHMDCGDYVVVVNAKHVALTGRKRTDKNFYWHSNYPGGLKSRTMGERLDGPYPERVLQKAVERMLPKGPLGRKQIKHLKVFVGADHTHSAQNPKVLDVAARNSKNSRAPTLSN